MPLYNPVSTLRGDVVIDPRDHGLLGWTYDPAAGSAGGTLTTGLQYFMRIAVPRTVTFSNIWFVVTGVASTLTAGANNLAIYDSAGNRLAATADQTTNYTTSGAKTVAFTSTATVAGGPGVFVWAAMKSTGTTPVAVARAGAAVAALTNVGLAAAASRAATNGTVTGALLPSTITPSSNTQATNLIWMGLS